MLETNYKFGEVNKLAQIENEDTRVSFKNIFTNNNGGVSLVAFRKGQKLDTHTAPEEVMVNVLEGEIEFTMIDTPHRIKAGEFMLMGENVPHKVFAVNDSLVMLIKIKA